jgi:hypothetical protein
MGHFLTTQADEVTAAIQKGRVLLGIACYVVAWVGRPDPNPAFIPLRRLCRPDTDDYLYTTSQAEADSAVQHAGYVFETIACNVWDSNQPLPPNWNLVPLLRLYNPQTGGTFLHDSGRDDPGKYPCQAPASWFPNRNDSWHSVRPVSHSSSRMVDGSAILPPVTHRG